MELEEEQKTKNFPNQDQNDYENIEIIPQIPLTDQQIQKYTEQAKQFKQLYDNFTSITFEKDPNTEYFLLSTKFLKRWKALVSYEEAIADKPLNKFAGGPQIFEKINQDLVVNVGNENMSEKLNELTQQKQWNEKYFQNFFYHEGPSEKLKIDQSHFNIFLKENIQEEADYIFINQEIWNFFIQQFQGIPIKRVCHKINDQKIIEVRPLRFNIVFLDHQFLKQMDMQKLTDFRYKYLIQLSKYLSVQEMYDYLQNFLEQKLTSSYIKQNYEIRVWQIDESISEKEFFIKTQKTCQNTCNVDYKIKVDGNYINPEQQDVQNISELNLTPEQLVMVEYRDDKYDSKFCFYNSQVPEMGKCENCTQIKILKHPCSCQQALYCSESCKQKDWVFHEGRCTAPVNEGEKPKQKKDSKLGITGLNNIGNTCFMNSGLQCLSNCFELTQYFLSDLYENDLNKDAPLGTKGELTQQYGRLIYNLWFGNQDSYVPRNFKKILSTYHKIFQGYNQHDSQEFLTELLSSMHEDLNLIKQKQFNEIQDDAGPQEYWENFAQRNNSIISQNFNGQFKSQLTCPDCNRLSITYDPYYMVSLPVPQKDSVKTLKLTFIDVNNENYFTDLEINYNKAEKPTMSALLTQIKKLVKCNDKQFSLQLTGKYSYDQDVLLQDEAQDIKKKSRFRSLIVRNYTPSELKLLNENQGEIMQITITHKKQEKNYSSFKETLVPLIKYYFNKNLTFKELHQQIFQMFKNFVSESYDQNLDLDQNLQNLLAVEQNENDKEQDVESQKKTPIYKITFDSKNGMDDCMFCQQRYCRDCLLEYTDKFTLQDIYNNYEKNSYNKDFCPEFEIEWLKYDEKFNDENESNIFKVQKNLQDKEKSKNLNDQREKIEVEDEQKCNEVQNGAAAVQEEQKVDTELEYLNLNGYQRQQQQEQKKMDLYACLDHFQTPEKLDEFNEVYCRNCKEHKLMEKQMNIYSAPQIMIFHFKRFYRKNHNSAFMKKIQTNIDFPIEGLDLTNYVLTKQNPGVFDQNNIESNENENQDQNLIYDLFGVSNHSGSLMSGHYTAYCKNPLNQKWYYFNDSSVSEVFDINNIISDQAYVLFYRKRNSQLTFEELQNQIYDRLYQGMENKPEIIYPIKPLDTILQEEKQQMENGVQKQNNKEDQNQN